MDGNSDKFLNVLHHLLFRASDMFSKHLLATGVASSGASASVRRGVSLGRRVAPPEYSAGTLVEGGSVTVSL